MKKIVISLFVVLTLISACTSVNIVSQRHPSYEGEIKSLLVITSFPYDLKRFESYLHKEIDNNFSRSELEYKLMKIPVLDNDPSLNMLSRLISDTSKKNVVLVSHGDHEVGPDMGVGFNHMTGFAESQVIGISKKYKLSVKILNKELRKNIWQAKITTRGDEYTGKKMEGRDTAKKIVEKLVEDGLLTPAVLKGD